LLGHSLGGTLAAIHAAAARDDIRGLVLLNAPLSFQQGSSRFRDAIVALTAPLLSGIDSVPGTLVSHLSALACPETFLWSRSADAFFSASDPVALETHARVERWALDEVALPGRLFHEILEWLYRENRFCTATLTLRNQQIGPFSVAIPVLAVVTAGDDIAPTGSIDPFLEAMPSADVQRLVHEREIGVGLQHLAILVGRSAHDRTWPRIGAWLTHHA
jgi:polyhydroxyalkanoate synthase